MERDCIDLRVEALMTTVRQTPQAGGTTLRRSGLHASLSDPVLDTMNFLNEILDRPANERPFLLLVVGQPAAGATVPDIQKKQLAEIATFR